MKLFNSSKSLRRLLSYDEFSERLMEIKYPGSIWREKGFYITKLLLYDIIYVFHFWDCETFDDLGPSKYHYFMNFCFQSVKMELWIFIFSSKIQISHSKLPLLFNPGHNCATLPNITIFLWTPIFKYATVMYLDVLFTIPRERSRDSFESIFVTHRGHLRS